MDLQRLFKHPDGKAHNIALRGGWAIGGAINKIALHVTGVTLSIMLANAVYDAVHNESSNDNQPSDQGSRQNGSDNKPRSTLPRA